MLERGGLYNNLNVLAPLLCCVVLCCVYRSPTLYRAIDETKCRVRGVAERMTDE
jgi:hypothetical protein